MRELYRKHLWVFPAIIAYIVGGIIKILAFILALFFYAFLAANEHKTNNKFYTKMKSIFIFLILLAGAEEVLER